MRPEAREKAVGCFVFPASIGGSRHWPQACTWFVPNPVRVRRKRASKHRDLQLTWPSAGYGESDRIVVGIGSPVAVEIEGQTSYVTRSQVRCSVPASEGRVTLPASLMADTLTPSTERQGSVFIGVIRPEIAAAVFSAPGIDHGIVRFTYSRFESVDIE